MKAYGQAYTLDQTHLPTIQGLAEAHFALKDWEKASKFYQVLLMQHREDLSPDEVVQAFHQLGVVKLEQGERRKALNMFDKALEQDPGHRTTLAARDRDPRRRQRLGPGHPLQEAAARRRRARRASHAAARDCRPLEGQARQPQQGHRERSPKRSSIEPKNHVLLHKLLQLYQETKQWKDATEIIQRVADLDERTAAKAKYAYTVGVIMRDELKDVEGALARFNEALDLDVTQLKPFEAINKLLTTMKDWKGLERAFRKMLHRMMATPNPDKELQFNLWHNLGVIYRDRLKQMESSAQAFKMASDAEARGRAGAPDPGRALRQAAQQVQRRRGRVRVPAPAGSAEGGHLSLAVQAVLRQSRVRQGLVRRPHADVPAQADTDQSNFYEQYKVASGNPSSRLTAQHWLTDLYHPDQDREVSMVFRSLCGPLFDSRYAAVTDKTTGLAKLKPVDFAKETASVAQAFAMSLQVLSPDVRPRLFLRSDMPYSLKSELVTPPATTCGMLLLRGYKPKDLQFITAHHLAYHRAEHYIRKMLPSAQELREALIVAMRSVGEGTPEAEKVWAVLRAKMQPSQVEEIAKACKIFAKRGMRTDIKRFIQTVELTACRAGFLVSNDLDASVAMLSQLESAGPDDLSPTEKTKELILFSVSQEYFRLREAIGIALRLQ